MAWFNAVTLEVSNAMIQNPVNDLHWHFYIQVCFEFWKKAYVRYRIFYPALQAFLSLVLKSGAVGYDLANSVTEGLRNAAPHHDAPEVAVSSAIFKI